MEKVDLNGKQEKEREYSDYWMQMYTNDRYDLVNNYPEDVQLPWIANSLAQIPRFNGHLQRHLSVAQHSCMVAAVMERDGLPKSVCLQGLMHDAHEAIIGDITSPLKWYWKECLGFDVEEATKPIKIAISKRFGVDIVNLPDSVEYYDLLIMKGEALTGFTRIVDKWTDRILPHANSIEKPNTVFDIPDSYSWFVKCFHHFGGDINYNYKEDDKFNL